MLRFQWTMEARSQALMEDKQSLLTYFWYVGLKDNIFPTVLTQLLSLQTDNDRIQTVWRFKSHPERLHFWREKSTCVQLWHSNETWTQPRCKVPGIQWEFEKSTVFHWCGNLVEKDLNKSECTHRLGQFPFISECFDSHLKPLALDS